MPGPRSLISGILNRLRGTPRIRTPSADWLRSPAYDEEMSVALVGEPGLNEAEQETENYRHRHHEANRRLAIWRWRGMQDHMEHILPLIENGQTVVDFGGAACPLGLGSLVVDMLERDGCGNKVEHHSISDIGRPVDVVFTSHCLEHIEPLDEVLAEIRSTMAEDGVLITFVPAWTCVRWRAGVHRNAHFNDHVWTFALADDDEVPELERLSRIDAVIGAHFEVQEAAYCGDDSIFVLARAA